MKLKLSLHLYAPHNEVGRRLQSSPFHGCFAGFRTKRTYHSSASVVQASSSLSRIGSQHRQSFAQFMIALHLNFCLRS